MRTRGSMRTKFMGTSGKAVRPRPPGPFRRPCSRSGWVCDLGAVRHKSRGICATEEWTLRSRSVRRDVDAGSASESRFAVCADFDAASGCARRTRRRGGILLDHSHSAIESCGSLAGIRRVLRLGGLFLFTFHSGQRRQPPRGIVWEPVSLDIVWFTTEEMSGYMQAAGLQVEEVLERDPYAPEVEYQSRRGYILASR